MPNPIPILRSELAADPLGRGYAAMTDQQAADSLNERNRPAPLRPIPSGDLLGWSAAGANSGLPSDLARNQRLTAAASDASAPETAGIAEAALVLLTRVESDLDVVMYSTSIAALVIGGVFTQAESDELTGLATPADISRATEIGVGEVGIGWVQLAR